MTTSLMKAYYYPTLQQQLIARTRYEDFVEFGGYAQVSDIAVRIRKLGQLEYE